MSHLRLAFFAQQNTLEIHLRVSTFVLFYCCVVFHSAMYLKTSFFKKKYLFIYLFMAVLGLGCYTWAFLVVVSRGFSC